MRPTRSAAGWPGPPATSSSRSTIVWRPSILTRPPSTTRTTVACGPTRTPGRSGVRGIRSVSAARAPAVTSLRSSACSRGPDAEIEISRQILLQPVVDFTLSYPSIGMPASECLVPREDLAWYYEEYYEGDSRDFRVSPVFADDLSGLPPALIITAEHDTLRDEGKAYADRLESSGVPTTVQLLQRHGPRLPADGRAGRRGPASYRRNLTLREAGCGRVYLSARV